ncbi:peptidase [Thermococcus sp. LS1]|uniref:M1 family metallopeptidase n=1 Tax=Thermococcus sp. LS1 TaxID=1638259 RepID=UPI001438B579|nr:M1 family metallopeptidase [Thermococcus sp. LS1]NJD99711.1 peptidase [Thermococcus sp. LS1]
MKYLSLNLVLDFETATIYGYAKIEFENPQRTVLLNKGLEVVNSSVPFAQSIKPLKGFEDFKVRAVELESSAGELSLEYRGKLESYAGVLPYLKDSVNPEYTLLRTDSLFYPVPSKANVQELIGKVSSSNFDAEIKLSGVSEGYAIGFGGEIKGNILKIRGTNRLDIAIAPFDVVERKNLRFFVLDVEGIEKTARLVERAFEFYSGLFGERDVFYTIIEIPDGYGGQAGKGYQLVEGRALRAEIPAGIYHELAHLWNPRATPEAHLSRFFDEAFANYLTALAIREIHGEDAFRRFMENLRRNYRAIVRKFPEAERLKPSEWGRLGLGELSYTKGALILHELHRKAGNFFYEILRRLVREERVDFEVFREIVKETTGLELDI